MDVPIEGLTHEELLEVPDEAFDELALHGRPLILRIGSAEVLGQFLIQGEALVVELAHIDGGGEGVLPSLSRFIRKYARRRGLQRVDWIVHAVDCARPNPKLRRVLERKGFRIVDASYRLTEEL